MSVDAKQLSQQAAQMGFPAQSLEKVFRLLDLLQILFKHPYLKSRLALKGGTALNLFSFDVPRLSVDIDLNYVGAEDRETMLQERPKLEQAISAACSREQLSVRRVPDDHAGGKWRLSYQAALGGTGTLELDVNFMLRMPLWPPVLRQSRVVGGRSASGVWVLDDNELAAGKLAALLARHASRDLFDAHRLLGTGALDAQRLRLAFVVYGGINRKDWRLVSVDDVAFDAAEVARELVPMLRADLAPGRAHIPAWTDQLVRECRERLAAVLPLSDAEQEFLRRLNDEGEIAPELLTEDDELQSRITRHPGLLWKAQNVREYRERTTDG